MTAPKKHHETDCYNLIWVLEVISDDLWTPIATGGDEGKMLKDQYEYAKMLREAGLDSRTRVSTFRRTYD